MIKKYVWLILIMLSVPLVNGLTEYNLTNTGGFCDSYSNGECNITINKDFNDDLYIRDFTTIRVDSGIYLRTSNNAEDITIFNVTNLIGGGSIYCLGDGSATTGRASGIMNISQGTLIDNLNIYTQGEGGASGNPPYAGGNAENVYISDFNLINNSYIYNTGGGGGGSSGGGSSADSGDSLPISITNIGKIQNTNISNIGKVGTTSGPGQDRNGGLGGDALGLDIDSVTTITNSIIWSVGADGGSAREQATGGNAGQVNPLNISNVVTFDGTILSTGGRGGSCTNFEPSSVGTPSNGGDINLFNVDNIVSSTLINSTGGNGGGGSNCNAGNGATGGQINISGGDDYLIGNVVSHGGQGGSSTFYNKGNGGAGGKIFVDGVNANMSNVYSRGGAEGTTGGGSKSSGGNDDITIDLTGYGYGTGWFCDRAGGETTGGSCGITISSSDLQVPTITTTASDVVNLNASTLISNNVSGQSHIILESTSAEVNYVTGKNMTSDVNITGDTYFLGRVIGGNMNIDIGTLTNNNTQDWIVGETSITADYLTLNNNLSTSNVVNMTINVSTEFYQTLTETFVQWGDNINFYATTQRLGDMLFQSSQSTGGFIETRFNWENETNKFITFVYTGSFTNQVIDGGGVVPNNAPSVSNVRLSPNEPYVGSGIDCLYSASDVDGDTLNISIDWFTNGVINNITGTNLPAENISAGESIKCRVTANDGTTTTTASSGSAVVSASQSSDGGGGASTTPSETLSITETPLPQPTLIDGELVSEPSEEVIVTPDGFIQIPDGVFVDFTIAFDGDGDGLFTGPLDDWDGDGIINSLDQTIFGVEDSLYLILPEGEQTIIVTEEGEKVETQVFSFERPSYSCLVLSTPTTCEGEIFIKLDVPLRNGVIRVSENLAGVIDASVCDDEGNCFKEGFGIEEGFTAKLKIVARANEDIGGLLKDEKTLFGEIMIVGDDGSSWSVPYLYERFPLYPSVRATSEFTGFNERPVSVAVYGGSAIAGLVLFFGALVVVL